MQQDTTASLLVHYDNGSRFSSMTDNLSKLSWVFDFDSEVLLSGPYERAFRSSLRNSLRRFKKDKENPILEKAVSASLKRRWSTEAVNGDAVDECETQSFTECTTMSPPHENQHLESAVYNGNEVITRSYRPDESTQGATGDIVSGDSSPTLRIPQTEEVSPPQKPQ